MFSISFSLFFVTLIKFNWHLSSVWAAGVCHIRDVSTRPVQCYRFNIDCACWPIQALLSKLCFWTMSQCPLCQQLRLTAKGGLLNGSLSSPWVGAILLFPWRQEGAVGSQAAVFLVLLAELISKVMSLSFIKELQSYISRKTTKSVIPSKLVFWRIYLNEWP